MKQVKFKQVDVFTEINFKGNPVAVILEADSLSTLEMQEIANWTNLAETTFVLKPTNNNADYRVRIFTPQNELPFAGHPTIGTAYALLESKIIKRKKKIIQECESGLIELTYIEKDKLIYFELPKENYSDIDNCSIMELYKAIPNLVFKQKPLIVEVGLRWIVAELSNIENLLSLNVDFNILGDFYSKFGAAGVCLFSQNPTINSDIEVRTFIPLTGANEDPVCGGGNGAVAAYMKHINNFNGSYIASQGQKLNRAGNIFINFQNDKILVGGKAITCIEGVINLK